MEEGEKIKALIALGVPGEEGGPRRRRRLSEICSPDPSDWPLWAYNAAEYVRIAPSAVNLQPWRLSFAGRTLMLSSARPNASLDMGIAMLHMMTAVADVRHHWEWGRDKCVAHLIAEENP